MSATSGRRAIVIGAGLSGLAIAYELTRQKWDVLVLEATERPGGRVKTVREPFHDGLYAEAGAEGINAKHTHVLRYTTEFGLPLKPIGILGERSQTLSILSTPWSVRLRFRGRVYSIPGLMINPFRIPYRLTLRERLVFPLGLTDRYTRRLEKRYLDIANPLQSDLLHLDSVSFADFLVEAGASPEAIAVIEEQHLFASLKQLSALYMIWEQARRDFDGRFFRIEGGNERLPKALAEPLGARIQYDSPVRRVEQTRAGVTVTYDSARGEVEAAAAIAVCAVSIPAARRIAFEPTLSPAKHMAFEQIGYTSLLKTHVQFDRRFWEKTGWSGVGYSDRPMQYLLHVTTDQPGPHGILTSFATGTHAHALAAHGDAAPRTVCDQIAELDPAAAGAFVGGCVTDWDRDPWVGGTHPQFGVGQMTQFWTALGQPEGRVHFAGEHTSYWTGWMNGALQSAERVQQEILVRSDA